MSGDRFTSHSFDSDGSSKHGVETKPVLEFLFEYKPVESVSNIDLRDEIVPLPTSGLE